MRHHRSIFAIACVSAALAACSNPAPPAADTAPIAAAAPVAPAIADEAGLRQAASAALSEQRIYTPAGDNAIEHYLALRRLRADDTTLATALLELLPYALIASEQAVGRGDFEEARRLLVLIEQIDAQAPALPRLREGIAVAEAEAARRLIAEAEAAKQKEQQAALAAAAAAQAEPEPARPEATLAAVPAPPVIAAPAPATPPAAPAAPPPAPAAVVATRPVATPQLLSAPPPRYPLVALRRKIEGSVTLEFTIQPDGSVSSARVVSADPPGLFEEAALAAASRWRFERTPAAVPAARVVQFRLAATTPAP